MFQWLKLSVLENTIANISRCFIGIDFQEVRDKFCRHIKVTILFRKFFNESSFFLKIQQKNSFNIFYLLSTFESVNRSLVLKRKEEDRGHVFIG